MTPLIHFMRGRPWKECHYKTLRTLQRTMAQIMKQMLGMFAGEANESLTKIASGIPLGDKGHGSHKLDVRSTRRMSNSPTSRASAAKLLGNAGPDEMDTRISIQI